MALPRSKSPPMRLQTRTHPPRTTSSVAGPAMSGTESYATHGAAPHVGSGMETEMEKEME